MPPLMASNTRFSPWAFDHAPSKTSASISREITTTPSRSPKMASPGRTSTLPIRTGQRKSTTVPRVFVDPARPGRQKAREPDGEDARRVARPAVDHHAGGAAVRALVGHELSPRRMGPRRTAASVHFARLRIRRAHAASIRTGRWAIRRRLSGPSQRRCRPRAPASRARRRPCRPAGAESPAAGTGAGSEKMRVSPITAENDSPTGQCEELFVRSPGRRGASNTHAISRRRPSPRESRRRDSHDALPPATGGYGLRMRCRSRAGGGVVTLTQHHVDLRSMVRLMVEQDWRHPVRARFPRSPCPGCSYTQTSAPRTRHRAHRRTTG